MGSDAGQKTLELSRPSTDRRVAPRVRVTSGPSKGRACAISGAAITVGRHATNDLVVDDPGVSGIQLRIAPLGERLVVRDDGSTNGTWMGDVRVHEVEVAQGTELRIGESKLLFDTDEIVRAEPAARGSFGLLVGRSRAMRELFAQLERVAPKDIAVLITGDTGTGKEEAARALHANGARRAEGPFVAVDATALPEAVAEQVLLERLAAAKGGTLFLDNVGEFTPLMQARLLRAIEDPTVALDLRVVAATSRDLRHAIDAKAFREDLYFRLAQMRITIPPLRDRLEDVADLVPALLARIAPNEKLRVLPEALDWMRRQPWPGNVRELKNTLLAAAAMATEGEIRRRDVAGDPGHAIQGSLDLAGAFSDAKDRAVARFEAAYLAALMVRCGGNISLAARESQIARHHLRDLLKKRDLYGVDWSAGDE